MNVRTYYQKLDRYRFWVKNDLWIAMKHEWNILFQKHGYICFILPFPLLRRENCQWTDCIVDKIIKDIEVVEVITTALKGVLNLVKLQSLVGCEML